MNKLESISYQVKRISEADTNVKLDHLKKKLVEGIVHE